MQVSLTAIISWFVSKMWHKTFYKENGHYRLQPENDSMDPIIVDDVQILGKVCGVFRIFL